MDDDEFDGPLDIEAWVTIACVFSLAIVSGLMAVMVIVR